MSEREVESIGYFESRVFFKNGRKRVVRDGSLAE
jgi:hypothetical protein